MFPDVFIFSGVYKKRVYMFLIENKTQNETQTETETQNLLTPILPTIQTSNENGRRLICTTGLHLIIRATF
jgi:hypothetical protein